MTGGSARSAVSASAVVAVIVAVVVVLVGVVVAAHSSPERVGPTPTFHTVGLPPLAQLARRRDLAVGAGVNLWRIRRDARYADTLARNFTSVTEQNDFKMRVLAPAPGQFNFVPADRMVGFAEDHGLRVRGNTLVWGSGVPEWVAQRAWTRPALLRFLHRYITAVVGHFRGRVAQWDVVNEPFSPTSPELLPSLWERVIGPAYIPLAFRWAHEADPSARLFLNDYANDLPGPHARAEYRLLRRLRAEGVPVDGVGLQMHRAVDAPTPRQALFVMRAYAGLGLQVEITELDIPLPAQPSTADLVRQAQLYRALAGDCVAVPRCTGITVWGLDDDDRYPPLPARHLGAATLFDGDDRPKLAYNGLAQALAFAAGRPAGTAAGPRGPDGLAGRSRRLAWLCREMREGQWRPSPISSRVT